MPKIREIAAQSGLSPATVDRVLHRRGGVRAGTVREVEQAIADLDRPRPGGRTYVVDVVVQSAAVRAAIEAELPGRRPAMVRCRFHFPESGELVAVLDRIARNRSHGVILQAPDLPEVMKAVARLDQQGTPVVAFGTDLPTSARTAYAGMDHRSAGATGAYLVRQWLGDRPGEVLVVRGPGSLHGEDEREMGFRACLRAVGDQRQLREIVVEEDRGEAVHSRTRELLAAHPGVRAVYSLYAGAGGNRAVIDAFDRERKGYDVFVAHELDGENGELLRGGRLSAVLHHDLGQDLRNACDLVLQAQGALPGPARSRPSAVRVVTPHNLPGGSGPESPRPVRHAREVNAERIPL